MEGEGEVDMSALIQQFMAMFGVDKEAVAKQKIRRRIARSKRREAGEEDVSDDSDSDTESKMTEEEKEAHEAKKKEILEDYENKLQEHLDNDRVFTYEKLVEGLKAGSFKKIVVCTGAGISVSAGIPDFRSKHTGLYANL